MKPILRPLVALLACPFLFGGGCIAWEIRDQMRAANSHIARTEWRLEDVTRDIEETSTRLAQVQATLTQTEATLAGTHATLAQVSGQLTAVHASLQKTDDHLVAVGALIETTHPKLTTLDGDLDRMMILGDVNTSLKNVDLALKPLSKSMGMLSSAASFFGGGDNQDLLARESVPSEPATPEPAPRDEGAAAAAPGASPPVVASPPAATAAATPPSPATTGTPPAPGTRAAPAEPPRPDLLVGTWLLVYPPPAPPQRYGRAIILTADGAFLDAEPDKPLSRGHWTRTGRSVTMRPDAGDEATAELLTLTTRTLTLRRGDEIKVYSRP